jgi:hypothetical protein
VILIGLRRGDQHVQVLLCRIRGLIPVPAETLTLVWIIITGYVAGRVWHIRDSRMVGCLEETTMLRAIGLRALLSVAVANLVYLYKPICYITSVMIQATYSMGVGIQLLDPVTIVQEEEKPKVT